ncbi:MAG: sugar phosphate isomerase/epimerase [Caldiserica bacterium]|nr:sugar phosphate isomerase/epimerase [Caldisericota bacterium]
MILGFLGGFTEEEFRFAKDIGFQGMEVNARPGSEFMKIWEEKSEEGIRELLDKYKIKITALATYMNHLSPDKEERKEANTHLLALIEIASKLGIETVATFAGRIPELSVEENIPEFKKVFTPVVKKAEERGIKIAIENCPMMHGHPFRGINIAYSPKIWEIMLEEIPSPSLGLEFDPSHLLWLGVDYIKVLKKFVGKVFHFHAKDTEILEDKIEEETIFGKGWWQYRIPGFGEIEWEKIIHILQENAYKGGFAIEHEDPIFSGERREEGLMLGYKYLSRYF